jgi:hypothetical protein
LIFLIIAGGKSEKFLDVWSTTTPLLKENPELHTCPFYYYFVLVVGRCI